MTQAPGKQHKCGLYLSHLTCTIVQVDVHLTNFITDLKLRQANPLAISATSSITEAHVQHNSRLSAITISLTLPHAENEHADNDTQSSPAESIAGGAFQEGPPQEQSAKTDQAGKSVGECLHVDADNGDHEHAQCHNLPGWV